ncbi:MAG: DNA-3-methyladenine glycosylase I [Armatimonadetes bacterium]|nr:DNA-3-methyladenine glycosylase I [Armatimonadota bacterium]
MQAPGSLFVGPTICYVFTQAVGMANDLTTECFRYGGGGNPELTSLPHRVAIPWVRRQAREGPRPGAPPAPASHTTSPSYPSR